MSNPRPWLELTEFASLICLLIGSAIAVISGNVFFLALPVTVSILLNIINRFRLQQSTRQRTTAALSKLYQQISENIKSLEQQIYSKSIRRDVGNHTSASSIELNQLQQAIASLQVQFHSRINKVNNPDLETIYQTFEDIALQRELIHSLEKKVLILEKTLSNVPNILSNSSLQARVENIEKTLAQISEEIASIYSQIETKKDESKQVSIQQVDIPIETPPQTSLRAIAPLPIDENKLDQNLAAISVPELPPPNWKCKHTLTAHTDWVRTLAISPDGKTLASGGFDKNIKLWKLSTGKLTNTFTKHNSGVFCLAFSPDGQILASGNFDQSIKLWDWKSGEIRHNLIAHSGSVQCIAISSCSQMLVSGSFDESIKIWQTDTGKLIDTITELTGPVSAIALSPDGHTIASGGGDGMISLWQISSIQNSLWLPLGIINSTSSLIWSLAISPDGQTLVSGSADGRITLFGLSSGEQLAVLEGHSAPVTSVVITPDGETAISGSADGKIKLWHLATGQDIGTITDDANFSVISIAISPQGDTLASGSTDGKIKIWVRK